VKKSKLPFYLVQVSYNSEGWAALVKNPQNRFEKIRPAIEKLGGKLREAYFAFGEYDVVAIGEFPNNASAAAIAIAFAAGGAVKSTKTTPLMTVEEGMDALYKAAESGYQPATKPTVQVTA
jgi:uncharacterized protein with GYD domain